MKYLVHFRPAPGFCWLIDAYKRQDLGDAIIRPPTSGDHCTLMMPRIDHEREQEIVDRLRHISHSKFRVDTGWMDVFDNSSLVMLLQNNPLLQGLHEQVIMSLGDMLDWDETPSLDMPHAADMERLRVYRSYGSPYVEQYFEPHMSFGEIDPEETDVAKLDKTHFDGLDYEVSSFQLLRREEDGWEEVETFKLE